MKKIGIIAGAVALIVSAVGAKKLHTKAKKAKAKDPNADLMRTFDAFKKEVLKSDDATLKAIDLMTELEKEMDDRIGMDPEEINTHIEETLSPVGVA